MLNGLHLCLAYYGLSEKYEYMHELYQNDASKIFIDQISLEILESIFLLGKDEIEELTKFKNTINDRFSNTEVKDQLFRVARNPGIKFSYNERFQEPLDILINNDKSVTGFKKVLDIIFNDSFEDIEGFNDFKKEVLNLGRSNFYKNFWNQDKNYEKYLNMLGG
jgi:mannitol-1-phosphate 5-dehydrogenase